MILLSSLLYQAKAVSSFGISLIKALREFWKDTLAVLAIILIIEITEYISKRGSFDVDDIILNLLGAMIGYGIWKLKLLQKLVGFIQNKDDEKKD